MGSDACSQLCVVLKSPELWRVLVCAFAAFLVGAQWTAAEIVAPSFFARTMGEAVPIYSVLNINLWGCMLLPPIVGALTSHREAFSIILPGMWLMAASPALHARQELTAEAHGREDQIVARHAAQIAHEHVARGGGALERRIQGRRAPPAVEAL